MKFSTPMIVLMGILAALVVLRVITPSPEQVMMDELTQQNQMIQQQTMSMMNGMETQMNPYQNNYAQPGYSQEGGYPQGGYQQNGYQQNQYQQGTYQENTGYNGNPGYSNNGEVNYAPQGGDDWNW